MRYFPQSVWICSINCCKRKDESIHTLGVHSGDHAIYPDCRPEFYNALEHAFAIGNWDSDQISFELPYIDGDKVTILEDAIVSCTKLDLDFDTVLGIQTLHMSR